MTQIKFRLDSDEMLVRMKLTAKEVKRFLPNLDDRDEYEWNDKSIAVGFDALDLGEETGDGFSWWIVSDLPIGPGDREYDHVGRAAWLSPAGQRFEDAEAVKRVEICDEWLINLFGSIPESLWFKRTK
jgi:hypothetical protein